MPIGPRKGALASVTVDDMEESLLRAMEEDPRLTSGAGVPRADNVLDFIQMTGLTTGRVPASSAMPAERADDPISFFEIGVRDVDGTGDPIETAYPELDTDAFHIDTREIVPAESQSVAELKKIIADLASMEMDDAPANVAASIAPAPIAVQAAERDTAPDVDQPTEELQEVDVEDEGGAIAGDEEYESPMRSPASLAAARELLEELAQANQAAERAERAFARAIPQPVPVVRLTPDDAPAALAAGGASAPAVTDDEAAEPTTHHGLVKRSRGPSLRTWSLRLLVLLLAAAGGWGAFTVYDRAAKPPRAAFDAAQSLIERGQYEEASTAFLDFASRFEGNPRRADAMYMAGYALQLVPEEPAARAKEAYTEAIALLNHFAEEYPAHEKTPRAETLMGVSYYRTGRYLEAINILGAPDRRLRDPGGYLTALRTLGRSYASISQMENARSAFMRAAALESNMQADEDYAELAGLYTQLAERSGDPAQRRRHFQQAVEQWDFALQVPGLLKNRKADMKLLRDVAASKVEGEFDGATASVTPGARVRVEPRVSIEGDAGAVAPVQ